MTVVSVSETARQPCERGYERIDAVLHHAVDPAHPHNRTVVDLDLAPVGDDGKVHFDSDVIILRPTDPGRSSGKLLGWVSNRGRNALLPFSAPPAGFVPRLGADIELGNGFLLERGWTVALLGWQWDVQRQPGLVGLAAPIAGGATTRVTVQFQPNLARTTERLAHWPWHPAPAHMDACHEAYPVADLHEAGARLTMAPYLGAPETEIPRDRWGFVDDTHVEYAEGFLAGVVYSVTYTTARCPVAGTGLLAVRDAVSHLRRTEPTVQHVYGAGVSQTGRFLREFLHGGFNVDEGGARVFDGLHIQVAGARRGEFNVRGAQPSAQYLPHSPTFAPPYGYDELLSTQRHRGAVPRIVHIDSSSEYWRSDAYLVHGEDGPPPEVRCYLMAGTQHFPGMSTLSKRPALMPEVEAANNLNTVNHAPLLRSTLLLLDRWVSEGVEPPRSQVPRLRDGTAMDRAEVLDAIGSADLDVTVPDVDKLLGACPVVAAVGADRNEIAGIRLPEIAVPLGVLTGWNSRAAGIGEGSQPVDMAGSMLPYRNLAPLESYLAELTRAADELVSRGWLLEEDRAGVIDGGRRLHRKLLDAVVR